MVVILKFRPMFKLNIIIARIYNWLQQRNQLEFMLMLQIGNFINLVYLVIVEMSSIMLLWQLVIHKIIGLYKIFWEFLGECKAISRLNKEILAEYVQMVFIQPFYFDLKILKKECQFYFNILRFFLYIIEIMLLYKKKYYYLYY